MTPTFFPSPNDFRRWLKKNHLKETELLVGFYKMKSGKPSMTWSESVDQAICFGWIDGIRKSIDAESYTIRFTPRKSSSIWSAINIKKVEDLTNAGMMTVEGLKAFSKKTDNKTNIYSHEKKSIVLDPAYEKILKKNKTAWDFFSSQPPGYKKVMTHWITSAKKEETRLSRLEKLIENSDNQKRILF